MERMYGVVGCCVATPPQGHPQVSAIQQGLLVDPWLRMEICMEIPLSTTRKLQLILTPKTCNYVGKHANVDTVPTHKARNARNAITRDSAQQADVWQLEGQVSCTKTHIHLILLPLGYRGWTCLGGFEDTPADLSTRYVITYKIKLERESLNHGHQEPLRFVFSRSSLAVALNS